MAASPPSPTPLSEHNQRFLTASLHPSPPKHQFQAISRQQYKRNKDTPGVSTITPHTSQAFRDTIGDQVKTIVCECRKLTHQGMVGLFPATSPPSFSPTPGYNQQLLPASFHPSPPKHQSQEISQQQHHGEQPHQDVSTQQDTRDIPSPVTMPSVRATLPPAPVNRHF